MTSEILNDHNNYINNKTIFSEEIDNWCDLL